MSVEGTLAGLLAGAVVAVVGAGASSVAYAVVLKWQLVAVLTLCAFLGSWLESVAGSWNRRQPKPIANGALNFLNTAAGAILFWVAARLLPLIEWRPVFDRLP